MLIIKNGGKLFKEDEEKKLIDVTNSAISFLFEECKLDDNVKLRDVFKIIGENLDIFDAILGNWCGEIVREGLSNNSNYTKDGEVEYLELYWMIYKDVDYDNPNIKTIGGYIFPNFHGVGFLATEDIFDQGYLVCAKGSRIGYSLSLSSPTEIIDLPLKLNYEVTLYNEDGPLDSNLEKFDRGLFTLGHILYGLIWELSFHGSPKSRNDFKNELNEVVAKI